VKEEGPAHGTRVVYSSYWWRGVRWLGVTKVRSGGRCVCVLSGTCQYVS